MQLNQNTELILRDYNFETFTCSLTFRERFTNRHNVRVYKGSAVVGGLSRSFMSVNVPLMKLSLYGDAESFGNKKTVVHEEKIYAIE